MVLRKARLLLPCPISTPSPAPRQQHQQLPATHITLPAGWHSCNCRRNPSAWNSNLECPPLPGEEIRHTHRNTQRPVRFWSTCCALCEVYFTFTLSRFDCFTFTLSRFDCFTFTLSPFDCFTFTLSPFNILFPFPTLYLPQTSASSLHTLLLPPPRAIVYTQ